MRCVYYISKKDVCQQKIRRTRRISIGLRAFFEGSEREGGRGNFLQDTPPCVPLVFCHSESFMSLSRIQPSFRIISEKTKERIAGAIINTTITPKTEGTVNPISVNTPRGPTRPQVPIPAETPEHSSLKRQVDIGPVIAEAKVAGIHIRGFFTILPI